MDAEQTTQPQPEEKPATVAVELLPADWHHMLRLMQMGAQKAIDDIAVKASMLTSAVEQKMQPAAEETP